MSSYNIYEDIAKRTNGDIYVGVVGPVRAGKSTFIRSFMEQFVLPNVKEQNVKIRAQDELPQSADGKLVMTTQPKFVPSSAVKVCLNDNINFSIRMIDCVGFMVDGAISGQDDGKVRMVKTPWFDEEVPFDKAADIGTKKVIQEHSNIGVLLTTDCSFGEFTRDNIEKAEMRTVKELKKSGKPFVIAVNSIDAKGEKCQALCAELEKKYDAPVVSINAQNLSEDDVHAMFAKVLAEFPVQSIKINLPLWIRGLDFEHELVQEVCAEFLEKTKNFTKISHFNGDTILFENSQHFERAVANSVGLGNGEITYVVDAKPSLLYSTLSSECGIDILDEYDLISNIKAFATAKKQYDKLEHALMQADEVGYGVVEPELADFVLNDTEVVKQGGKSAVQIRASAPSLHIIKVDVQAEVNSISSTPEQSASFANFIRDKYAENEQEVWQTNMFGKTLQELVQDGVNAKINGVSNVVKSKMQKTMQRVVNEGKGGVLCILL